jgi:uncharacterized RDD family membrane protein YckC
MTTPTPGRRALASVGDLGVIAGWLGLLTVLGAAGRAVAGSGSPAAAPPAAVDLAVFAMTVLPVGAYLAVTEAGPHQGGLGKRRTGLRVVTAAGGRPGLGRTVVRAAVKLLPWQLGHLAAARLIAGSALTPAILACYGLSLAVPVVSVAGALRDPHGRALHDRVAGTRVVRYS